MYVYKQIALQLFVKGFHNTTVEWQQFFGSTVFYGLTLQKSRKFPVFFYSVSDFKYICLYESLSQVSSQNKIAKKITFLRSSVFFSFKSKVSTYIKNRKTWNTKIIAGVARHGRNSQVPTCSPHKLLPPAISQYSTV